MQNERLTGVLMPLFSMRRENDHGIGDLSALREWIDWAADHGVGFLQLLPVNALGNDPVPSPYSAISSVALEPLYLSLEPWVMPGMPSRLVFPPDDLPPLQFPAGKNLVDYTRVRLWKKSILRQVWRAFTTGENYRTLMPHFEQWIIEQGDWLHDYACFCVASHLFGTNNWWQWPEQDPGKVRLIAEEYEDKIRYEKWLQWLCFYQWKMIREYADERHVALMGDVPIGVSMASADVFFERDNFDLNWCGGAPAEGDFADDPFTAKWGQNWGIPLYRWDAMEQNGYAWWKRRIEHTVRIFSMYRIDHILGFYRIYAFPWKPEENPVFLNLTPDEAAARCGGRRPGFQPHGDATFEERRDNLMRGDRLLRILLSAAPGARVIGEDLGCVPDYVRPDLSQLRIAGFMIPHWEIVDGRILPGCRYNPCSFATFATHDFPPIMESWNEWWEGVHAWLQVEKHPEDVDAQVLVQMRQKYDDCKRILLWFADFCGIGEEEVMSPWNQKIKDAMYRALFASRSQDAALMWTELFDIDVRLNTPGTTGGANWRPRLPFTAREARKLPQSAWLKAMIAEGGRTPKPGMTRRQALDAMGTPELLKMAHDYFSTPEEFTREMGKTKAELAE